MGLVKRLEPDGTTTEVSLETVGAEVLSGGLFTVADCLGPSGYFDTIVHTSLDVITELVGVSAAEAMRTRGFTEAHEILSAHDIMRVADAIQRRMERYVPDMLKALVPRVLGHTRDFFFELHPNVRFHVPFDAWRPHQAAYEEYAKNHGEGKVSPHDPHRDAWYRCPQNAINLWGAIGPVTRGNGMSLYPDVYARRLIRDQKKKLVHTQQFGRRVNFELAPGDVLVFHGNHLHASELNRTRSTRFVVSFRLTLTRPRVQSPSNHKYLWSGVNGGLVGRAVGLGEKVIRNAEAILNPAPSETLDVLPAAADATVRTDGDTLVLPAAAVPAGRLVPLPKGLCAARVDGRVVTFLRTCPHAAADLAMGSIEGVELSCPEHNLSFDLKTGKSPCSSLASLRFFETEQVGDDVVVHSRRRLPTAPEPS
jgi:nitrite reductase/ring-hydroxylating ferredoxin subunit